MARRGEARRDLWGLVYVNFSSMFRLCFEHAVIIIDSERNKVGYTLLYETTVLKYNHRQKDFSRYRGPKYGSF